MWDNVQGVGLDWHGIYLSRRFGRLEPALDTQSPGWSCGNVVVPPFPSEGEEIPGLRFRFGIGRHAVGCASSIGPI